ncbi:hypothetical protein MBLNU459_g0768t2 [Dothideomycetes sp. NU459]
MSSFLSASLLAHSQQSVQTRQALIVLGLQNDFVSPNGKLPVSNDSGYLDRIKELVPTFREHGIIIWVRSEYKEDRPVNSANTCMIVAEDEPRRGSGSGSGSGSARHQPHDPRTSSGSPPRRSHRTNNRVDNVLNRVMNRVSEHGTDVPTSISPSVDEEIFLTRTEDREPCCLPGTTGAEYAPDIAKLMQPQDLQITKSYYSAFSGTNLIFLLRTRFITEVYFIGCNTNLSVYATATDAAKHGIEMHIVMDCLGYRRKDRHDQAVKQLVDGMGAYATTASSVVSRLRGEVDMADAVAEEEEPDLDATEDDTGSADANRPSSHFFASADERTIEQTTQKDANLEQRIDQDVTLTSTATPEQHYAGDATRADESRNKYNDPSGKLSSIVNHNARIGTSSSRQTNPTLDHDQLSKAHQKVLARTNDSITHQPENEGIRNTRARDLAPAKRTKKRNQAQSTPTLGPSDMIGSGDSRIVLDLLPAPRSATMFQEILHEVYWQRMYHAAGEVPRLVCCQGDISTVDGSMPVYRHPSDQSLPLLHWSSSVANVRREAEARVGHKLNHVLIQLYRSGQDYISEHTDKTLDIVPGSKIVNVSFGAQRTMRLRTKKGAPDPQAASQYSAKRRKSNPGIVVDNPLVAAHPESAPENHDSSSSRTTQRIAMPHNSMFVMGLATNSVYLHGITADKRLQNERSAAELAYGSMRISLTFRRIGTFLSSDSRLIWGQGAVAKIQYTARSTINGVEEESQRLINAFGNENQSAEFDWLGTYGAGFDVLHLKSPLPATEPPLLFLSDGAHADLAIRMYLSHLGIEAHEIPCAIIPEAATAAAAAADIKDANGRPVAIKTSTTPHRTICFRDVDALHTQVTGETPILLYLDRCYARYLMSNSSLAMMSQAARELELLTSRMLSELRTAAAAAATDNEIDSAGLGLMAMRELEEWLLNTACSCTPDSGREDLRPQPQIAYLAGPEFGVADCAVWPLARCLLAQSFSSSSSPQPAETFPMMHAWVELVGSKGSVKKLTSDATTTTMTSNAQVT